MKLERFPHDSSALADFYEEGLTTLGALCERAWHDRLQAVAEGTAARLWNSDGAFYETELHFPPADSAPRDATREVFPGCPLTFRLADSLRPSPLPLERATLGESISARPPAPDVAEKLWRAQFPGTTRWRLEGAFAPAHHFSLVVVLRCEIQAIDQHWSLHRMALPLPHGGRDESLAASLDFAQVQPPHSELIHWPAPDVSHWRHLIEAALTEELAEALAAIRTRQENYLRRELDRIDDYFHSYQRELADRAKRAGESAKMKASARLAAAQAEHARRRADQVGRHEIRVHPHFDALLLVAEPAWRANIGTVQEHEPRTMPALFVSRARRWFLDETAPPK